MTSDIKIGLALGSGSARGWAHIGVIKTLVSHGIKPDIVCGTSVGSLVGVCYADNQLEKLEQWALAQTKLGTTRFLELSTSFKGFVNTTRFHQFLNEYVANDADLIEDLPIKFASVATELETGREVWLTKGSILEAVWSSMSMPGLFPAIKHNNKWLVDGGLVNPVPVSVCRALSADFVIAVNLNDGIVGKHLKRSKHEKSAVKPNKNGIVNKLSDLVQEYKPSMFEKSVDDNPPPSVFEAIISSVNITQDRITRSRMAGDPPDVLLAPKLSHFGLLEIHRAAEAIEEGRNCVERMLPEIKYALKLD
jgi:NTE family protein